MKTQYESGNVFVDSKKLKASLLSSLQDVLDGMKSVLLESARDLSRDLHADFIKRIQVRDKM